MTQEILRSVDVILPLLQLIALTLPVIAILAQVMVRVTISERDEEPSVVGHWAIVLVSLSSVMLVAVAINLLGELSQLLNQSAIDQALNSLIIAFAALAAGILLTFVEFRSIITSDSEGEKPKNTEKQSLLSQFGENEDDQNE